MAAAHRLSSSTFATVYSHSNPENAATHSCAAPWSTTLDAPPA